MILKDKRYDPKKAYLVPNLLCPPTNFAFKINEMKLFVIVGARRAVPETTQNYIKTVRNYMGVLPTPDGGNSLLV